ncbi:MAG: hypothetical protein ABSH51_01625 [Solirubrobacteraceae bacterium]
MASTRRETRVQLEVGAERRRRRERRTLGREGERPRGPFGGLPVSEVVILLGLIALVAGFIDGGGPAVIAGIVLCALGVVEITAREHFAGYRSHTALLAAIPAIAVEAAVVLAFGEPRQRALLLLAAVPVFAVLFWWLRRRFLRARQARIARESVPRAPAG